MNPELEMLFRVLVATLLGGAVGYDRQKHDKPAGLRTHMLVAAGAALFTASAELASGNRLDLLRVTAAVATGIGFLGAGAIMRSGENVSGLTVHRLAVPYRNDMGYPRRVAAFARFAFAATWRVLTLRGDVVYATSTPLTVAIPALACRLLRGTPYVFEVRDLWPEIPIALSSSPSCAPPRGSPASRTRSACASGSGRPRSSCAGAARLPSG